MIRLAKRFWAWRWAAFASWWALWISMQTFAAWRSDMRWTWILLIDGCWLVGIPMSIAQARLRARHTVGSADASPVDAA